MKSIKKVFFLVLLICLICMFSNVYAADDINSVISGMSGVSEGDGKIDAIDTIIGILQVAGTGISLVTISLLGIKYIIASVEERADIKKQAVPIVIGCILLFGAVNVMSIVEKFATTLNS